MIRSLFCLLALSSLGAVEVAVNEYLGMTYTQEPVSFDYEVTPPLPSNTLGLANTVSQIELLEGSPEAAKRVRIWTNVDLKGPTQVRFTIGTGTQTAGPLPVASGSYGQIPLGEIGNAQIRLRIPLPGITPSGTLRFPQALPSVAVPGPIASLSLDGKTWLGTGYLDCRRMVESITWAWESGPVYQQMRLIYSFVGGKTYTAQIRLYSGKSWVSLIEDSNLGDDSRFIISTDTLPVTRYHLPSDANFDRWFPLSQKGSVSDTSEDFIQIEGQRCLARLTLWSQFNYIRGKQEQLGVAIADPAWDIAIGSFICRPERWTRAKWNHVDLYQRSEVLGTNPEARLTRGRVGLDKSEPRMAFESWLTDGHRETGWYLRKVTTWKEKNPSTGEGQSAAPSSFASKDPFFILAHVTEGIWNLDRLNRLHLSWNADGSVPSLDDQKPSGSLGSFGGDIDTVLKSTVGRCGLMHFNGSNPGVRNKMPAAAKELKKWALANPDLKGALALQKAPKGSQLSARQVGPALICLMAMDDSAYPGPRAMLPWSDPEALNPFYQGMENMNFNTDRFEMIDHLAEALEVLGCPWAHEAMKYTEGQYRDQLARYVYPQSGCWEESHTYAGSILRATRDIGMKLRARTAWNPFADELVQRVHTFWSKVLFPRDPGFKDLRGVAPIGDHGGPNMGRAKLASIIPEFLAANTPSATITAANLAWLVGEHGEPTATLGVAPQKPEWKSCWLQGYGAVLRATDTKERESMLIVRAEQSWGHHHQDKGSLWFWCRNVHFFGDSSWGSPPGSGYWNPYKQGPNGHTELELIGVNNWTLPCKYPAPFIADESFGDGIDWCIARCLYPYNPPLDLKRSTPPALKNGYDRSIFFIHPDILIVRDDVESTCPTIWRLHSLQAEGTTVQGSKATLASPQGFTGDLAIVHPTSAAITTITKHELADGTGKIPNEHFGKKPGELDGKGKNPAVFDTRSVLLQWEMPYGASASWTFSVRESVQAPIKVERLDEQGRVLRLQHADGREIISCLSSRPFTWRGAGLDFSGQAGVLIRQGDKVTVHKIRADRCEATQ